MSCVMAARSLARVSDADWARRVCVVDTKHSIINAIRRVARHIGIKTGMGGRSRIEILALASESIAVNAPAQALACLQDGLRAPIGSTWVVPRAYWDQQIRKRESQVEEGTKCSPLSYFRSRSWRSRNSRCTTGARSWPQWRANRYPRACWRRLAWTTVR